MGKRFKINPRRIDSFLRDDSFEELTDSESLKILRRALRLPPIFYLKKPCLRCKRDFPCQFKAKIRQRWHCRICLKSLALETRGVSEAMIGR